MFCFFYLDQISVGRVYCGEVYCGEVYCREVYCVEVYFGVSILWGSILWGSIFWGKYIVGIILRGTRRWAMMSGALSRTAFNTGNITSGVCRQWHLSGVGAAYRTIDRRAGERTGGRADGRTGWWLQSECCSRTAYKTRTRSSRSSQLHLLRRQNVTKTWTCLLTYFNSFLNWNHESWINTKKNNILLRNKNPEKCRSRFLSRKLIKHGEDTVPKELPAGQTFSTVGPSLSSGGPTFSTVGPTFSTAGPTLSPDCSVHVEEDVGRRMRFRERTVVEEVVSCRKTIWSPPTEIEPCIGSAWSGGPIVRDTSTVLRQFTDLIQPMAFRLKENGKTRIYF